MEHSELQEGYSEEGHRKNLESLTFDEPNQVALEVTNLLQSTHPIDMDTNINLLDVTNMTSNISQQPRYPGGECLNESQGTIYDKSRNSQFSVAKTSSQQNVTEPVLLRDCKPKKNKFDNYKVFSDTRASKLRQQELSKSQTSFESRNTANNLKKNDSSLLLDDGSLASNNGHTIPREDRGLLLKQAEQTVSKDAKKKMKK